MKLRFSKLSVRFVMLLVVAMASSTAYSATNIIIENVDQPGVGFNDQTAATPVGGNSGITLGAQRMNAFQRAADIWGATLPNGPAITVRASWATDMPCEATSGALGGASTFGIFRNFPGAPYANTWFSSPLANTLSGNDLDPANPEIIARFNLKLGTTGCLENSSWYYGLDTNHVSGQINLVNVLLHEFSHGLGFQTFTNTHSTGAQIQGFPSVFDRFLYDNTTNKNWTEMTDAERVSSAINAGNLVWSGPQVTIDATTLTAGKDSQGRPRMFSPNPVRPGSSVAHWDSALSPNQLMEPNFTAGLTHSVSAPQDLTFSLLSDIGWCVSNCPPVQSPSPTPSPTPASPYVITGQIKDTQNNPLPDVQITFDVEMQGLLFSKFTQTDGAGAYSSGDLGCPTSVRIKLSKAGYTFTPAGMLLVGGNQCLSGNFTANFTASSGTPTPTPTPPPAGFQFTSTNYAATENVTSVQVTVTRFDTSTNATVDYVTSDNSALNDCSVINGLGSSRCDYATSIGTLKFAPGEGIKAFFIPLVNDSYAEGNEIFNVSLGNAVGAPLGMTTTASITIQDNESTNGTNPLDGVDFFIRQQYIDFLGREPDAAGMAGWRNVLNNCGTTVQPPCDRIEVSAGFFRSEEFQSRGYFVYRFYSAVGRIPLSGEFFPDVAKLSGFQSVDQLEASKTAYVNEVIARGEFQTRYAATFSNPTSYVDALLQTVGLPNHPSRTGWISMLNSGNTAQNRAIVLRQLVESSEVYSKYYNEAFVIMQYFGYLRRTADASYLNWIQTMNSTGGDYRIMINGFMNSSEYRRRFGP